jgi:hypothetical protein
MKRVFIFALAGAVMLAPVIVLSEEIEDMSEPTGSEMSSAAEEAENTAAPVSADVETEKGILNVTTYPAGAEISLDGNVVGVSPISGMAVEVGGHAVRAERPWYYVKEVVITVEAGKTTDLHLSLVEKESGDEAEEIVTWWHKYRLLIILATLGGAVLVSAIAVAVRSID